MEENTLIGFVKPRTISDPLTELLRMGARKLIEAAIQAELSEFLGQFEQRKTSEGKRGVIRNGYQPEREILTGVGAVSVPDSEGPEPDRRRSNLSICAGSSVCSENKISGSGASLALPQGDFDRRDAGGSIRSAGTRSQRTLPWRDSTTEGKLAPGRLRVEETASGQRPLGVSLGGRNLQRNSGQFGTFMRSCDCWSE